MIQIDHEITCHSFQTMSDDDHFNRGRWAEKSGAAMRREEEAKKAFETLRLEMEARNDLEAGFRETIELLKPSCHLTQACWKSFRAHVLSFEGWTAKRRAATETEKKESKEKRKGTVYFTEVTYSVKKVAKKNWKVKSKIQNKRQIEETSDLSSCESGDDFETPANKKAKGNL